MNYIEKKQELEREPIDDNYITYISRTSINSYDIPTSSVIFSSEFQRIEKHSKSLYIFPQLSTTSKQFNGSIIIYNKITGEWAYEFESKCPDNYRYFICYRKQNINETNESELWIYELENLKTCDIIGNYCLLNSVIYENYEDPRFFIFKNQLYISYVYWKNIYKTNNTDIPVIDWKTEKNMKIMQKCVPIYIDKNLQKLFVNKTEELIPPYGNNLTSVQGGKEKNWIFFEMNNKLYILYNILPFTLVEYDINKNQCKLINQLTSIISAGITLRSSTPILFDKKLGVYKLYLHCTDYNIYECTFKFNTGNTRNTGNTGNTGSRGDFNDLVIDIPPEPVMSSIYQISAESGGLNDTIYPPEKKYCNGVLFPCGLLYDISTGQDIISLGINDIKLGLFFRC